ncbi:TIGR03086 family metal-binding protein [Pseudonocardia spinosispora]|uniref:TIGR03086 family metal-binding protein n=1 Tax=Pseudonocardia spinosispora TaxID=103441 RepID=UPI0003FFDC1B|nr:TIGR03086 family metal-binding protein [Pseudonocardia spinosispora]
MTQQTDPRPLYRDALTWVRGLIENVKTDQFSLPTPCPEFDTRVMLGHLVTVVERSRVVGEGGSAFSIPLVTEEVPGDDWASAFGDSVEKMLSVWSDDGLLDTTVTVPWGTMPGRAALWGYLDEALVHGWDLAIATGQDPEGPAEASEAALAVFTQVLPAEPRGGDVPFGPPVDPAPSAGPTERLANWVGHRR